MNKRIYLFLAGILLLIVAVTSFILYLNSHGKTPAAQPAANATQSATGNQNNSADQTTNNNQLGSSSDIVGNDQGLPSSNQNDPALSALSAVSSTAAISPEISPDGKALLYFDNAGNMYQQNLASGITKKLVYNPGMPVNSVIWPLTGNDFILVNNSASAKKFIYFNSTASSFVNYPSNVKEVQFMPSGIKVLYEWAADDGSYELSIADPDLSNHNKVATMPGPDDLLAVSSAGDKVLAYDRSKPTNGKLYYISLDTGKLITIKTGVNNAALWSPDGEHFVFNKLNATNSKDSQLWLGDIATSQDQPLGVSTTMDKVTFDQAGSALYLALPASDSSGDSIWRIEMNGLAKTELFASSSENKIVASDLFVSNDGKILYFKNSDSLVYSIGTGVAQ